MSAQQMAKKGIFFIEFLGPLKPGIIWSQTRSRSGNHQLPSVIFNWLLDDARATGGQSERPCRAAAWKSDQRDRASAVSNKSQDQRIVSI